MFLRTHGEAFHPRYPSSFPDLAQLSAIQYADRTPSGPIYSPAITGQHEFHAVMPTQVENGFYLSATSFFLNFIADHATIDSIAIFDGQNSVFQANSLGWTGSHLNFDPDFWLPSINKRIDFPLILVTASFAIRQQPVGAHAIGSLQFVGATLSCESVRIPIPPLPHPPK